MPEEIVVDSLGSILAAYRSAVNKWGRIPWARGHGKADAEWKLVPGVWRRFGKRLRPEKNAFAHFRNGAYGCRESCPEFNDHLSWLMLMQHFGLPTRLLDWTTSLGAAVVFCAVDANGLDADGAIWLLNPNNLNIYHGGRVRGDLGLLVQDDVTKLAAGAEFDEQFNGKVLSVLPPAKNERLVRQSGAFTLHGHPQPLEDLSQSDDFLIKLIVRAAAKSVLREELGCLGLTRDFLFPDLDSLSLSIAETIAEGVRRGNFGAELRYP